MNRKGSCLLVVVTILSIFGVQLNLALDGYDLLCPRNDLARISAEVRRCEQVCVPFMLVKLTPEVRGNFIT